MKQNKESRLSFRIPGDLNEKIEELIENDNRLKDRSDFGTKAVLSYIDYLSHIENFDNLAISTILKIASASKIENDDINVLKEILNDMKESN